MILEALQPINLAKLGVKRKTPEPDADLLTLWEMPYPIIANYMKFCNDAGLSAFGGGTIKKQGSVRPGFVNSGYRDVALEGRTESPHGFAFALDIVIGDAKAQAKVAPIADKHFCRVGLYPENGIIHVDLAPNIWITAHNGARYWVRKGGKYTSFTTLEEAVRFSLPNP